MFCIFRTYLCTIQMHKTVAFILALLYLSSTSGMVVNVHYCMGKVSSFQAQFIAKDSCPKCAATTKSHCCRDEVKVYKVNQAHTQAAVSQSIQVPVIQLATLVTTGFVQYCNFSGSQQPLANPPPLLSARSILIRNCIFRI